LPLGSAKGQHSESANKEFWKKMQIALQSRQPDSLQLLLNSYSTSGKDSIENAVYYRFLGDYHQMKARTDSAEYFYMQWLQLFLSKEMKHEASLLSEKMMSLYNMQQLNSEKLLQKFDSLIPIIYRKFPLNLATNWLTSNIIILINIQKEKEANILLNKGFEQILATDTFAQFRSFFAL